MIRAMTAKQAVFLAYRKGNVDLAALRTEHRSIQARKVGKDTVQIRFRDSESWMTVEDFASNYLNKILKDLSDQLTAASKVLSPEELLDGLTDDCRHLVESAGVESVLARDLAVSLDEYNRLVDDYNALNTAKQNVDSQLSAVSAELRKCQRDLEVAEGFSHEVKRKLIDREKTLIDMKQEILDSSVMGMLKRATVEQKFSDYGV